RRSARFVWHPHDGQRYYFAHAERSSQKVVPRTLSALVAEGSPFCDPSLCRPTLESLEHLTYGRRARRGEAFAEECGPTRRVFLRRAPSRNGNPEPSRTSEVGWGAPWRVGLQLDTGRICSNAIQLENANGKPASEPNSRFPAGA